MLHHRALICLVFVCSLSLTATAQMNPFRGSKGTPLRSDDLTALGDATTRLLEQPQIKVGASDSWNNPTSGIAGTVTAGQPTTRKGLACRVTNYAITGPGNEPPRKAVLTWCKTKDGWKLG